MKLGFGFDQLLIDVLEQAIGAVGKRIMNWFINCVVAVAFGAVDMGDRVASSARYSSLRSGMVDIVESGIIKGPAEERHDVVTARAPPRSFYVAIAFERYLARFPHTEQVRFVVEGTEMMGAVKPALVSVLVAI